MRAAAWTNTPSLQSCPNHHFRGHFGSSGTGVPWLLLRLNERCSTFTILWLGVKEMEMSMTCLVVLLVVLDTCFLWKLVFGMHEGHVATITNVGHFQNDDLLKSVVHAGLVGHRRRRIPRRSHLMESWLFTSLTVTRG